jgi:SSS family solute:Na+ symporter
MTIQIIVISLYVLATILVGVFSTRRKKQSSSSFNGYGLGVLMCIAVGAGEWLGGTSTTGVAEYGFIYGLSGAWYTIANAIGIIVLALFFAKTFRKKKTITVPGLMDSYIGGKSRLVSSIIQIFILIVVGTSQLIAIGTIGEVIFGLNSTLSIFILGSAVVLYTVFGGMNAVGKTNIMHMLVMYFGVIVAVIVCLSQNGGFSSITSSSNISQSTFNMGTIGWEKISSWIIASILGGCVAQAGLQPVLAAKDDKTATRASIITALVVAPFGLLTAFLGILAKVKFGGTVSAKLALPTLLSSLNPFLGGLLLASILAAVLSTASPIFLSCGTIFTRDIVQVYSKDEKMHDKKQLLFSKLSTLIAGVLCIILAAILYNLQKVLDIVYFAYGLRGSMFVVLLLGMYWKKVSPTMACIAMISTVLIGLFWVIWKQITGSYPISNHITDTYVSIISALVITLFGSLIINASKKIKKGESKTN